MDAGITSCLGAAAVWGLEEQGEGAFHAIATASTPFHTFHTPHTLHACLAPSPQAARLTVASTTRSTRCPGLPPLAARPTLSTPLTPFTCMVPSSQAARLTAASIIRSTRRPTAAPPRRACCRRSPASSAKVWTCPHFPRSRVRTGSRGLAPRGRLQAWRTSPMQA